MPKQLSELVSTGKLTDDYVVTKHLGAGAFSEVKLAKKKSNDKSCAVKILQRDHPEFNEVSRAPSKLFAARRGPLHLQPVALGLT